MKISLSACAAVALAVGMLSSGAALGQKGGGGGAAGPADPSLGAGRGPMPIASLDNRGQAPPDPAADAAMAARRHLDAVKHMQSDARDMQKLSEQLDSQLNQATAAVEAAGGSPDKALKEEIRECRKIQKAASDLDKRMTDE